MKTFDGYKKRNLTDKDYALLAGGGHKALDTLFSALSSDTTNAIKITVGGTEKSIPTSTLKTSLGLGSNAYTSTAYLPLAGGTMSGSITIGSGNTKPIVFTGGEYLDPSGNIVLPTTVGSYNIFKGSISPSTSMLHIDVATTNVGLGTYSPSYKLHAVGDIYASATVRAGTQFLINSSDTSASRYVSFLGKTGTSYLAFGYANSEGNQAEIGYTYSSSSSTSNYVTLGLHSSPKRIHMYYSGNAGVGTAGMTCNYAWTVAGDSYSSGYTRAESGFVKGGSSNDYVLLGGGGHTSLATINADTVDGVHLSSISSIKYIGFTADFCYDVILLCKRDVAHRTRLDGQLFTTEGGVSRYHCADVHFWFSCWAIGNYEVRKSIVNKAIPDYNFRFVTCTYNGEVWYAIKLDRILAVSYYFLGTYDNINFSLITYYHTSQGVKNSEINNSISVLSSDPVRVDASNIILEGDSRLTNSRPASDVYAWAKAATKPTYTYSEVGAAAASHTHNYMPWNNVSSLNANDVSPGWYNSSASITNAAHTNHSSLLYVNNVGTPYQLQIPDSSVLYIYKRWYSGGWSAWSKISAGYADSAGYLYTTSIGGSGDSHASALQNYFNNYKSSTPRNCAVSFYSSAYGNGSQYMGYFLSGYDSAPYGGFFIAHYDNCYYVGISNGSYNQQTIITSKNYSSYALPLSGGTCTGNIYAPHFYESSDIRYKKILRNLSITSNTIANLPLFDFEWIENNSIGTGTSAQAVQKILPNIVSGTDKLTLDYGVLGTIAGITACKELVTLKSEIDLLKERIKELELKLKMINDY